MNVANLRTAGRWLALCCLPLLAGSCGKRPAIADMRCEYLASPISVDTPSPRFTWTYEDADAFVQAGYRLCVATAPEKLNHPDIWNSGEIAGSRPFAAMPDGGLLVSRTPYYWRVEAWDPGGRRIVSPVAEFETALMETSEWQARWITDAHDKDFVPAPMLRRAFAVRSGVECARLYVSAAAYAKMSLNGEPVSGNLLDPGYTHYDKRNLYAVHDVTDRLREGENVLSAVLGNGFYNAIQPVATWSFEVARWRGRARMICELHIRRYARGRLLRRFVAHDGRRSLPLEQHLQRRRLRRPQGDSRLGPSRIRRFGVGAGRRSRGPFAVAESPVDARCSGHVRDGACRGPFVRRHDLGVRFRRQPYGPLPLGDRGRARHADHNDPRRIRAAFGAHRDAQSRYLL